MSRNYIHYYASPLPGNRAILMMDVVIDDKIQNDLSMATGSPAPLETVKQHERMFDLNPLIERAQVTTSVPNGDGPRSRVLSAVIAYGEPALISVLESRTGLGRQVIRRNLDSLEKDGLVRETTGQVKFTKWAPTPAALEESKS
jgi:hypothetical protein